MKTATLVLFISFILIAINAFSQSRTSTHTPIPGTYEVMDTGSNMLGARQEIIDWLNQKFTLYKVSNSPYPDAPVESVMFDGCTIQMKNVFQVPDEKVENVTIKLAEIKSINFFDMNKGTLCFRYEDGMVYVGININKEPDLLNRIENSIDYLKNYCTNN